ILDPGIANVPFPGDCPIKGAASRRYLADGERNLLSNAGEGLAEARPRNAPADGVKLGDHSVHMRAGMRPLGEFHESPPRQAACRDWFWMDTASPIDLCLESTHGRQATPEIHDRIS